jgi:hypothetical protein
MVATDAVRILRPEEVEEVKVQARRDYERRWQIRFGFPAPRELIRHWYGPDGSEDLSEQVGYLELALAEARYNEGLARSEFTHAIQTLADSWLARDEAGVAQCRDELLALLPKEDQ